MVAIIQARMGSTRFPGKVLADLQGRPVLDWVVEAVKRVDGVDEIVVATTTNSEDQVIEEWCLSEGVNCFRGEPLDVLKRYADCAREYEATHVVRITADCPLLSPSTASKVLSEGLRLGADYFALSGGFPDGLDCEGFRAEALFRADSGATLPSDREHVTPYMKKNPSLFRFAGVELWRGLGALRVTIDEPADLFFLRSVLENLPPHGDRPSTDSVLGVLKSREDLRALVAHIPRNEGYARSLKSDGEALESGSTTTSGVG